MKNRAKKRKNQHLARSNRCLVGAIFTWQDAAPLSEGRIHVEKSNISHRNPVFKVNVAKVLAKFGDYITKNQAFNWQLDVDMHCHDGQREYINGSELQATCKFTEINDAAIQVIEELISEANMAHYQHFTFTAEIKGAA